MSTESGMVLVPRELLTSLSFTLALVGMSNIGRGNCGTRSNLNTARKKLDGCIALAAAPASPTPQDAGAWKIGAATRMQKWLEKQDVAVSYVFALRAIEAALTEPPK